MGVPMIIDIFVLLLGIVIFLCWFGYYSKIRMFAVVGMSILFLLGAWIILYNSTGQDLYGLEYRTGQTITTYNSTVTGTLYNYTTYNDNTTFWVGFLLSITGLSGIFLVLMNDH